MSKGEVQSNFDQLGIDIYSSPMMILKAVMAASGGPAKFVTYKEIVESLKKMRKKKPYTKAYIYRHLSNLEKEGYLVIDAVQKPRKYAISESGILGSFEKKKERALSELQGKRQEVTTRLNMLKSVNSESFAFVVFNQLMGLESVQGSIIIEGIENVRSTIIREFGEAAKTGDMIRVMAPGSILDKGLKKSGMAEMSLMARAVDGVKIFGLLMPAEGKLEFTTKLIANYVKDIADTFARLAATGNIGLKIAKKNYQTYRMVSLNSEKMLLYLTHVAESDMAALIQRKDNPGLIDDAVKTFDTIYEEGIDPSMLTASQ
ncbi:MAG: hypothetical protein ACTSSE_09895 [Candidatus Thorarchaeota archaeon]